MAAAESNPLVGGGLETSWQYEQNQQAGCLLPAGADINQAIWQDSGEPEVPTEMQISCIQHPANDRFLTIHRWQMEFCNGNQCAAALLSFFESCHNEHLQAGKDLLQRHTIEQLEQAILIFKRDSILAALKLLVARNAIEIPKNPNPRLQLEKHFRLKPQVINAWFAESARPDAGGV